MTDWFSRIRRSPAILALLAGNMLPVLGVLLWDWDVRAIVTLYWAENLILGAITLCKMLHLAGLRSLSRALFSMLFFLFHYGAFCAGHGLFISELFAPADPLELGSAYPQLGPLSLFLEPVVAIFGAASKLWLLAFMALAGSHAVSFFLNYLGQGEYRYETTNSLMSAPYGRIFILHVTVLIGGIAVTELGSPLLLVVALVVMKTLVDLRMHEREHRRPGRAYDRRRVEPGTVLTETLEISTPDRNSDS